MLENLPNEICKHIYSYIGSKTALIIKEKMNYYKEKYPEHNDTTLYEFKIINNTIADQELYLEYIDIEYYKTDSITTYNALKELQNIRYEYIY